MYFYPITSLSLLTLTIFNCYFFSYFYPILPKNFLSIYSTHLSNYSTHLSIHLIIYFYSFIIIHHFIIIISNSRNFIYYLTTISLNSSSHYPNFLSFNHYLSLIYLIIPHTITLIILIMSHITSFLYYSTLTHPIFSIYLYSINQLFIYLNSLHCPSHFTTKLFFLIITSLL
jgi:hypothetical protein